MNHLLIMNAGLGLFALVIAMFGLYLFTILGDRKDLQFRSLFQVSALLGSAVAFYSSCIAAGNVIDLVLQT